MNQRLISVLSLIGLFSVAFLSVELARKWNEQNGHNVRRKLLEAPHSDDIPGKNLVLELTRLNEDIYDVTESMIQDATIDQVISWKEGWEFKYWLDGADGTEAMILKSTGWGGGYKTLIVYRGSEEGQDWWTNLDFFKKPFPDSPAGVEAHRGFQESIFDNQRIRTVNEAKQTQVVTGESAFTLLKTVALQVMGNTNEIYLTGHSLGGALAQLTATRLANMLPNIKVTMISVGGPRVGNEKFKNWSNDISNLAVWRYVYDDDIVTRIPTNTGTDYYHAGHTFQIWQGDLFQAALSEIYYRHTGDRQKGYDGASFLWYFATSGSDHSIKTYMKHFTNKYDVDKFWPRYFLGGTPYPTAAPTDIPSSYPTDMPSSHPPSSVCDVSGFQGSTISFEAFNACWKAELAENGELIGDFVYPECLKNDFSNGQVFSYFDSFDSSNTQILFTNDSTNWSGYFTISQSSDVIDIKVAQSDTNPTTKEFALDLVSPSCLPPVSCLAENFIGEIMYVEGLGACIRIEIAEAGTVSIDSSDIGCSKQDSAGETILSVFSDINGNKIHFSDPDGWNGTFILKESNDGTGPKLGENPTYNEKEQTFLADLIVPSCNN